MDTTQEFQMVPVGEIHEHPQNPRRGNVELIDESMEELGFYGACTVHRQTGDIIAGNHRYRTAVARGATEVPVVWYDGTPENALRILLADNKTADGGEYDQDSLDAILRSLPTLAGTGYGLDALAAEMDSAEPEVPVAAIPDDAYEPMYAIQIPCADEEDQQALYELLTRAFAKRGEDREIRVLAL